MDGGERGLVRELARILDLGECLHFDACPLGGGLIVNMDGYALRYSKYPFHTLEDWGYRAVAAAVSDVYASGGLPRAILYSIGVDSEDDARAVARGVAHAARELGVRVAKSDLNRAVEPWIDVAVVGFSERPVSRSGAGKGELLVQAGYLGYGLLEKLVYEGRIPLEEAVGVNGFTRRLPPPAGPVISRYATASSDNSDGWAATLWNIAEASRIRITVEEIHVEPGVARLLSKYGVDLDEAVYSWEDYNIAFTVKASRVGEVLEDCRNAGIPCWVVGEVEEGPPGVVYKGRSVSRGWEWL